MYFSSKISNSVITYLDSKDVDLGLVFEQTQTPVEFLQDPSYWMEAGELENFLNLVLQSTHKNELFLEDIGHANHELKSWGVLDSVLRMMPRPQEILAQPQRFLSYFISPEPPIENLKRSETEVAFDLPISTEQYPLVTSYLKAAFESLPLYVNQAAAKATWKGIHLSVSWTLDEQNSLFKDEDPGHRISPNLMQSIIDSMEKNQKELEEKNRVLLLKNEQLEQVRQNLELSFQNPSEPTQEANYFEATSNLLHHQLQRMQDYMVRAQQLVTILVGQDRMNSEVKEAMRRVDWDYVKKQFPISIQESREAIQKIRNLKRSADNVRDHSNHSS